jgi:hypothetical protein
MLQGMLAQVTLNIRPCCQKAANIKADMKRPICQIL